MELILKEDIKGLGFKNDLVDVKPGYGRNYLIPKGYAIQASASNRKVLAENLKQAAHKADKVRQDAEALAAGIGEGVLEIGAKVGENGKIFGRVTTTQISEALAKKGYNVDRKKISIQGEVSFLGEYSAILALHKEVSHTVRFAIVAE
jgi:large subunit ribosomal protein L9